MKKPINKFALGLWIIAAIFLIGDVPVTLELKRLFAEARYPQGPEMNSVLSWLNIWTEVRSVFVAAAQLAAWGVIIEIADQIRWAVQRRSE